MTTIINELKLTPAIQEKVASFYRYNSSNKWKLLSDFYNARTTRYHGVYNSDLFTMTTDKTVIKESGFSPLAKNIIKLNMNNPCVLQAIGLELQRQAKVKSEEQKREAEKIAMHNAVIAEATTYSIDEQFKQDINAANLLEGVNKSNKCASAMKGLMQRHGKEVITSDFWQVFRILKAKTNI